MGIKKPIAIVLIVFTLVLAHFYLIGQQNKITDLVDPFIGTGGHGHTYPGAVYPFGMVQLSPDTRLTGWDGCSGYHYSDTIVYGFSHTHLSGTGVSDYGDILFLPFQGKANTYEAGKPGSVFSHDREKAEPGYYQSHLDDYGIDVALTVSERCGFHAYTFAKGGKASILLDLKHRDFVSDSQIKINNEIEIEGYRYSSAWAKEQKIYFVAKLSLPMVDFELQNGQQESPDEKVINGDSLRAYLHFNVSKGDRILIKVGISSVDIEGARQNLKEEIPNWDFENVRKETALAWQNQLSKIQVFGANGTDERKFYTALYHTMIVPNVFSDTDGRFRGLDGKIYKNETYKSYTVFSLWDTYRATHPLYTLLEQNRTTEFINTFIAHHKQSGLLPVWELAGNETNCMIGSHAISVIADAVQKNIGGFNIEQAYLAMKESLNQDKHELNVFNGLGYIPSNEVMESVSKTLEYAYDNWCIAQTAKYLGKLEEYRKYIQRAQYYKNVFDPSTHFMRPKLNASWRSPFDAKEVDFNFTEANSWQYSFYVPQDISGLINLMGGDQNFDDKLDQLFTTDSKTTGRDQADITGFIGQYAHGNEPSHHMAYLYNYIGKPWKTQAMVKKIREKMYSVAPDGYVGNEDCGQLSAWYIFSALGFYPVTPGSADYIIGTPLFPRVILNFENGKHFIIEKIETGIGTSFINSVELNRSAYTKSYISQNDIMNGGKLVFVMGPEPGENWGTAVSDRPKSSIDNYPIVINPYLKDGKQAFVSSYKIEIAHNDPRMDLFYKLVNRKGKSKKWKKYKKPIVVKKSGKISFYAKDDKGNKSFIVTSNFNKLDERRTIKLKNAYSSLYTGGGELGLIDKIRGKESFAEGSWQGYQGTDFEATVDLGEMTEISTIKAGFLQEQNAWIWFPSQVDFYISQDDQNYKLAGSTKPGIDLKATGTIIEDVVLTFPKVDSRYVKIVAKSIGECPDWHPGAGRESWIFIDEIIIE